MFALSHPQISTGIPYGFEIEIRAGVYRIYYISNVPESPGQSRPVSVFIDCLESVERTGDYGASG